MTDPTVGGPQEDMVALLTAKPGCADELLRHIRILTPLVRAEAGCTRFDPYRDRDDPARFYIVESYRDEAAFRSHLATAYVDAFRAGAAETAVDASFDTLRRLDPITATDRNPS